MSLVSCTRCGEGISSNWIICPVCAQAVGREDGAEVRCTKCKGQITPETQICPHCHVPIIRHYCPGCSKLIPEQLIFCPYCKIDAHRKRSFWKRHSRSIAAAFVLILVGTAMSPYFQKKILSSTDSYPATIKQATPMPAAAAIFQPKAPEKPVIQDKVSEVPQENRLVGADNENSEPTSEPENASVSTETIAATDLPENREPEVGTQQDTAGEVQIPEPQPSPTQDTVTEPEPTPELEQRGARLQQGKKLNQIASRLLQQGRYQDAVLVLQHSVQAFPDGTKDLSYGEALYRLGYALRRSGKPAKAIPMLRESLRFSYYRNDALRELQSASAELNSPRSAKTQN